MLVVDSSFIAALLLPDEPSDKYSQVITILRDEGALAPMIWPIEMLNILLVAERRKRIASNQLALLLDSADQFDIRVEQSVTAAERRLTLDLARRLQLSAYDASYLELAVRTGAHLATLDQSLAKAAKSEGVLLAI